MSRFTLPSSDGSRFDRLTGYPNVGNLGGDQRDPYERRINDRYEDRRYDEYYYGRDDNRRDREERDRRWSPDRGSGRDRGYDRGYDSYRDNRNDGRRGIQNKMKGGNRGVRTRPSDAPHRAGILGAAPGEQPPVMPAELPGTMPSSMPAPASDPQQQVLAAIQAQQTQTLLAALQATQAQLNQQQGLLPTPNMPMRDQMNRNRRFAGNQQNRKRGYNQQGYSGPYNKRGRGSRGFEDRMDDRRDRQDNRGSQGQTTQSSQSPDVCNEMVNRVEELRKRKKIERNIADEDVSKLVVFCFDGKKYKCELCKIICQKEESFMQHLRGKKHNLVVIEARKAGKDVHRDITDIDLHSDNWLEENPHAKKILLKQSAEMFKAAEALKKIEEENFNKNPVNFVSYSIDTRKTAFKDNEMITFTSVSEAKVGIKQFSSENHMFGCEFIKAVFGFSCRLCDTFLRNGKDVLEHIEGNKHQSNYAELLEKNEQYVENQVQRNKELEAVLNEHMKKDVVLYESIDEENSMRMRGKRYIFSRDSSVVRVNQIIPEWTGKGQDAGEAGEAGEAEGKDEAHTDQVEEEGEGVEGETGTEEHEEEGETADHQVEEVAPQVETFQEHDEEEVDDRQFEEDELLEDDSEGYADGDAMEDDTDFDEKAFLEAAYGNEDEEEGADEEEYVEEEPEEEDKKETVGDEEYRPDEPTDDFVLEEQLSGKQNTQLASNTELEDNPPKEEGKKATCFTPPEKNVRRRGRGGIGRGRPRGSPRGGRGRAGRPTVAKYGTDRYEVIDEVGNDD